MIGQGTWGTCPWELDDNGNLTVYGGTGVGIRALEGVPWHRYRQYIYTVQISDAVNLEKDASLSYMFSNCKNLQYADLSGLLTENASAMNCMFQDCDNLIELDVSGFDTSNVISMSWMFRNCKSLANLDLSGFNTSRVTGMSGLFSSCSSLESVDLTGLDTSNVVSMISMFMNCNSLTSLDLSSFNTVKVTDMSWMFCNCTKLKQLNISGFNTASVMDMSQMFSSCKSLKSVNLSGFLTYNVKTMENMFLFCDSLKCLDLSVFDTRRTQDMTDMFTGCGNLCSIVMGSKFTMKDKAEASCRFPEKADENSEDKPWNSVATGERFSSTEIPDGMEDTYYIEGNDFGLSYIAVTEFGNMNDYDSVNKAGSCPPVIEPEVDAPYGFAFKEWNTRRDGRGRSYQPGQELDPIYTDISLYAIWASAPSMTPLEWPEAVTYGTRPVIKMPGVYDNNGQLTAFGAQVSPDGVDGWMPYDLECVPSVELDGYYLRFFASNYMGTTYTDCVNLVIDKAKYDMSLVEWNYKGAKTYSGQVQSVELVGLPAGITVSYEGNEALEVGSYLARAKISYDVVNYEMPHEIDPCSWEISKASYDMSRISWDYDVPFTYDGAAKTVKLTGLYGGLAAEYENNTAANAGVYNAAAILSYDENNFYPPEEIKPCVWGIKKVDFDVKNAHWDYKEAFTYDGSVKNVSVVELPEGLTVSYEGNSNTDAGIYKTTAYFDVEDKQNYKAPQSSSISWEIKKADYNMSGVFWEYDNSFVYDGSVKQVYLTGLAEGIKATYFENSGTEAGEYEAHASLSVDEPRNYNVPEISCLQWSIDKAYYDMDNVSWSYREPVVYDGTVKTVWLEALPEGLTPHYSGNSATFAGRYVAEATFTYDENNYYEPRVDSCSWSIEKAIYDMSSLRWINDEPLVYDGKEKSVYLDALPEGVKAEYSGNRATDAGVYSVSAVLHMEDQENYQDATTPEFMWEIKKAFYDMDNVRWSYEDSFVFDGEPKQVKLLNLPEGIKTIYSENTAVYAATYIATAVFEYDENNYEMPSFAECKWEIKKAEFKLDSVKWTYEEPFTFDGQLKTIKMTELPDGINVHYTGNEATGVGIYQATASFDVIDSENYYPPEPEECLWLIQKSPIDTSGIRWIGGNDLVFDGTEKEVLLTDLPEGLTVTYENNRKTNVGQYEASAYFEVVDYQNYDTPEAAKYTWSIEKAHIDMSGIQWICDGSLVYDGEEKTIHIENLPEGVIVDYEGNSGTYAGQYTARAVFDVLDSNNYHVPDSIEYIWEITKGQYNLENVHWTYDGNVVYDGNEKTVRLEGLPEGVYADYSGEFGINAGIYRACAVLHVDDNINYEDPQIEGIDWEIKKGCYDMSRIKWSYSEPFVYDGDEKMVQLEGIPDGVRAKYTNSSSRLAGKYLATAEFIVDDIDNYNVPEQESISWEIQKGVYDMSDVKWHCSEDYVYDGSEKEVHLTGLPEGVRAVYSENVQVNAGIYVATADIEGDFDNYQVPVVEAFGWTIHRAWLDVSGVSWDYREAFTYDERVKEIFLTGIPEDASAKYYNNKAVGAGEYYARAELVLNPDSNYKAPEIEGCTWEIRKAQYDLSCVVWDNRDDFVYDGTTKRIGLTGLPGGLTPQYTGNEEIGAGEYEAKVSFIYDEKNYLEPVVGSCKWKIAKAVHDMSDVKWSYEGAFVYDGTEKSVFLKPIEKPVSGFKKLFKQSERISLTGLPEGVTAKFEGNSAVEAGQYVAKALCQVDDPDNYQVPAVEDCQWTIEKADYDMSNVCWIDDGTYTYDGTEKSARLSNIPEGVTAVYSEDKAIDAGSHVSHATFRIEDEKNYNIPESIGFRWIIKKAQYDMSHVKWDYDRAFVYDEQEKFVRLQNLPGGISAIYHGNSSIDAGVFIASAEFDYDENNYEKPVVPSCKWKIAKASYDISEVKWDYDRPFFYDGREKAVTLLNLPDGVTAAYEHNRAIAVGVYTARVTYQYDEKNYQKPDAVRSCRWEIKESEADA